MSPVQIVQAIALVCFAAAAIWWRGEPLGWRLIGAGLFMWLLSVMIGGGR